MSAPLVSIHCNVFNAVDTVEEALVSALQEVDFSVEVVVADDGSTDGTAARLDALARRDPRIQVLHRRHEGIVATQRAALERCRGAFIAHTDADDVSLPGRLVRQLEFLQREDDLAAVTCRVEMFRDDDPAPPGMQRWGDWLNALTTPGEIHRERFIDSPVPHSTLLIRAEALRAVGGYRDAGWSEDYDLWLRLLGSGARMARVPEVLVRIRDRDDRVLRRDPSCTPEALRRCKLHHLRRGLLAGHRQVLLWGAGEVGKRWMKTLATAGLDVLAAVDLNPRKLGRTIHGCPVVLPARLLPHRDLPLLVAVGKPGARRDIRERLRALRRVEGTDTLFVA